MTPTKYLGKQNDEPEFFTVEELRDKLNELIEKGYGRAAVLLEKCYDPENYRDDTIFADKKTSFGLYTTRAVQLNLMEPNDDAYVANALGL